MTKRPQVWLVAEDSEDDFLLLQRAFRKFDASVKAVWVRDGDQAQSYLKGESGYANREAYPLPDLALVDLKMPQCSGMELLTWIRSIPRFDMLPVIIFSSSNHPSDVNLAYEQGANWYLTKPTDMAELVKAIQCMHEHSRIDWA